ncbi:hypothetical protein AL755_19270 [Arthrobacter sp. ERGS1:01]|uniref:hypothetical protein n=1 Tax=Arthrobacter sp. ERGS1:01 TaxID=1704044 RepID=UPI0006B4C7C7|nr:hypothetical protein [Arthrobacter sp. ERGS1:01]ALE07114.1 hypothetical protein AL755_19270 [Arthrobacter sp. ERGS1:01]
MTRPAHHRAFVHPDDHEVWPAMATDQPIALINERGWRLSGRVETLTNDRQCLWIQLDDGMGRQLIHHQDGFVLESGVHAG